MSKNMISITILLSAVITFILRALPFIAFRGSKRMPQKLEQLGKILPTAVMAVMLVYCLKDVGDNIKIIGIPKILAVVATAVLYKWKHNTLISILIGTVFYMILLRLVSIT